MEASQSEVSAPEKLGDITFKDDDGRMDPPHCCCGEENTVDPHEGCQRYIPIKLYLTQLCLQRTSLFTLYYPAYSDAT